jgi:ferredoxin
MATVMVYKVRFLNSDLDLDKTVEVPEGEYILDIADAADLRLPSGCRQGNCSACVVKVICGEIDQTEQVFLQDSEVEAGFAVTCVACALSDCVLLTHQEQTLYATSLYFNSQGKSQRTILSDKADRPNRS